MRPSLPKIDQVLRKLHLGGGAPTSERVQLTCLCGNRLQGERSAAVQPVLCEDCGSLLVMLPLSPRPLPSRPRRGQSLPWIDEGGIRSGGTLLPPPLPQKNTPSQLPPIPRVPGAETDEEPAAASYWQRLRTFARELPNRVRDSVRRQFTPLRLIVLAIATLIFVTGWWSWSSWRQRVFVARLEQSLVAGRTALEQGDFSVARRELTLAADAARGLHLRGERLTEPVQLAAEATLWSQLSATPLDRWLRETVPALPSEEWAEAFARQWAGRALIVDGMITRDSSIPWRQSVQEELTENGPLPLRSDWQVLFAGHRFELLLPEQPAVWGEIERDMPQRRIFGARIRGLRPAPADPGLWLIELEPAPLHLLTDAGALQRMGWPADEALQRTLQQQRELVGLGATGETQ